MSWDKSEMVDEINCKSITLGGRAFVIAPFTLRRIKKVAGLTPRVMKVDVQSMSEDAFEPFVDLIWQGLLGAYPKLTREEVEDMPMTMTEINTACDVIMEQMGGQKKLVNGAAQLGESSAASASKT